ncbi:BatA domain-containing protein [Maribacter sp. X9]|uniref:BatA domain-containing protein n=1 Tax=Maribacter sp. X9 TaxID=3402159 RepID=UPI003AF3B7FE
MQFKYPEILWGLFLLLIPIIIHLFQLRRFKKTPFTNVKFLKQVVAESRKSSTLKKWLLLATRLALLTALVIAFAQPFIANEAALQSKETVFYLDDSYSMNGQTENGNVFKNSVQEFIQEIPKDQRFTLFTNTKVFKDVEIKDVQNELLDLTVTSDQLDIPEIILKGNTYFSNTTGVQRNLVLISDFQQRMGNVPKDTMSDFNLHFIKPFKTEILNTSIDSVFVDNRTSETIEVVAIISTNTTEETLPVSLFNGTELIAKTAAKFDSNKTAEVRFTVNAKEVILGKVALTDNGLNYDNQFYFNIDEKSKIKVLSIGTSSDDFLMRIFSNDEFDHSSSTLGQLNYSKLDDQNLVVLNELLIIPTSLITSLNAFVTSGGSFVVIPAIDADFTSYNQLTSLYGNSQYVNAVVQNMAISTIKTEHPLFENVFDKKVANFQFPTVKERYKMETDLPVAIEFQNKEPFLVGNSSAYFFAAPLASDNSNFKNSPLIVPTFYNMGVNSLKLPPLYASLGNETEIEVPISLQQDDIVKISKEENEFIPQQQILPKKVKLTFIENPTEAGIYAITHNNNIIRNISFNDNRKESELLYAQLPAEHTNYSLSNFFQESQISNAINEFWKWFAILALAFVFIEMLLQRFLK